MERLEVAVDAELAAVALRGGFRSVPALQTTDLPINLIASIVEYASRSYFTRAFRAAYATDPKSFRASAAERDHASQLAVPPTLAERTISAVESVLGDEE